MAFDVTNPADRVALDNEMKLDPVTQGYRGPTPEDYYAVGRMSELTRLVNDTDAAGGTRSDFPFTGDDYAEAVFGGAQAELDEAYAKGGTGESVQFFSGYGQGFGSLTPIPFRFKTPLLQPWTGLAAGNTIRQALIALDTGPATRAEVLFGQGTVIRQSDVEASYGESGP